MEILIRIEQLKELSETAPEGYYDHITSGGTVENGMLFIDHATYAKLWSRYRVGARPSPPPALSAATSRFIFLYPGTLMSFFIKKITGFHSARCCRCSSRVKQMNQWGWWKSLFNFKTIAAWLAEEARKRGHYFPEPCSAITFCFYAVRAGFEELRDRKQSPIQSVR